MIDNGNFQITRRLFRTLTKGNIFLLSFTAATMQTRAKKLEFEIEFVVYDNVYSDSCLLLKIHFAKKGNILATR